MTSGAARDAEETSSPTHANANGTGAATQPHIHQLKQGMHYGSGTTSTLAINAFQQRVERNRTRDRRSERSVVSISRQNSSRSTNAQLMLATSARLSDAYQNGGATHSQAISSSSPPPFLRASTSPVGIDLVQSMINSSPGCYAGDDGSVDISDRYNFFAHGKRFLFATCSLGYFDETSKFRRRIIWFITSKLFDRLVLLLIFSNSIILAIADLSHVDASGDLDSTHSKRNTIVNYADGIFTTLFSIECSLKIIAMGLFGESGAYLMDPWNWVDFIVVFVGIVAAIPGIPSVSGLRAFRVLRPLRFFNAVPGIKKLVTALLKSIPELLTVVAFLSFLFFLYGVIGVQLWSGVMHSRCRLTPYPVYLDPNLTYSELPGYQEHVVADYSHYQCRDDTNQVIDVDDTAYSHDTSPWRVPRTCFWPVALEQTEKLCNLNSDNYRQCPDGQTCGSDYDSHGNFRFVHTDPQIEKRVLRASMYTSNLNFGIMSFDNIGAAAIILFICMPREGWSDLMYMLSDAGYSKSAVVFFITFVIASSYFMLNLALAVIWENFSEASFMEAEENKIRNEIELTGRRTSSMPNYAPTSRTRALVARLVQHWTFTAVRTFLILLNTVILSLDQYPIDYQLVDVVDVLNFALTVAFLIESTLKLVGLGTKLWMEDRYNLFDALVVVFGIAEIYLAPPNFFPGDDTAAANSKVKSFTGLRSIRIFALFKLARSWPSLHKLLETIVSTIREIGNFSVLLFLFMYIYALIGMQMFGNRFRFDSDGFPVDMTQPAVYIPRANFDTILWSMVTIFQVLTGENWNNVFVDGWRATGWTCVLYFISLVVFGNFIVLNLFLAILLSNFEDPGDDVQHVEEKEELRRKSRVTPSRSHPSSQSHVSEANKSSRFRQRSHRVGIGGAPTGAASNRSPSSGSSNTGRGDDKPSATINPKPPGMPPRLTKSPQAMANAQTRRMSNCNVTEVRSDTKDAHHRPSPPTGKSLFLFGPRNPIRKNAHAIVNHPYFDTIILVLLTASTISVALDNPLVAPDSSRTRVLAWLDLLLTILFVLEVVLKVIAQGLYFNANGYLKNNWNVMDFVITTIGVLSINSDGSKLAFLQNLRTFRALRPLRMINRNAGMKLVVSSLFASIPQILNVLMVVLLLLMIFSILAVNNFKGKFYSCNGNVFDALSDAQQALVTYPRLWSNLTADEQSWFPPVAAELYRNASSTAVTSASPLTSRVICGLFSATWDRSIPQSFDNVLYGVCTFFEISTTEGWITLMLAGVDATEIDMQPIPNYHEAWTLFFITFIFFGSFFVIQLFIGVVIENFNKMKEKLDGTYLLSGSQREWLMISTAIFNLRPLRKQKTPRTKLRKLCFRVAQSPTLKTIIMGCILLNTFIMALTYFGQDNLYKDAIDTSSYAFGLVFTAEAAVKIIGLGKYYWKDSWNIFDFVIVLTSSAGSLYTLAGGANTGGSALPIRSVRVARLIKLIQTAPSLRQLVNTLLITLPSLVSIGGLLLLVFFIYAALGVQLFAKVKMGELVTPTANFQSIGCAMTTLMRCATGERWNDLMHELSSTTDCVVDPNFDPNMCGFSSAKDCRLLNGCGSPVAFLYFCSFTLFVTFVLLNIFIAVILEGFANEKDRASGVLLPQHYENFVKTWSIFDPEATGYMEWHVFPRLIQQLEEPFGFGKDYEASVKEMTAFIEYLDISVYGGNRIFFSDVARKLGKFALDVVNEGRVEELPSTLEIDQKWRAVLKGSKIRKLERSTHRLNHIHAAVLLQDAVRSLIFREELKARVVKFTHLTKGSLAPQAAEAKATKLEATNQLVIKEEQSDDEEGEGRDPGSQGRSQEEAGDTGLAEEQGPHEDHIREKNAIQQLQDNHVYRTHPERLQEEQDESEEEDQHSEQRQTDAGSTKCHAK